MKYFVQLKDDVVFACHESSTEVDIPGDNIIEVDQNGSTYLMKKYVNGQFVDAPEIKYAILDESNGNTIVGIEKTVFSSQVNGPVINNSEVTFLWTWNGSEFVAPLRAEVIPTISFGNTLVTTSDLIPALTEEDFLAQEAQRIAEQEATQNPPPLPSSEPSES